MYSTMTVPGYPAATDGITYYTWTDSSRRRDIGYWNSNL